MKMIQKTIGMLAMVIMFSTTAWAATGESYAVKKAKEAVAEAESYDWKTLATSAKVCFRKGENTEQALEWINQSIKIQKDPINLEIKADYYAGIGEKNDALKYYSEAIDAGKKQNFWFDSSSLQSKIWELRK